MVTDTATGRRAFVDDEPQAPPPPPPQPKEESGPQLREMIEFGKLLDSGLGHVRGLLRDPNEREGLRFFVDLLRGKLAGEAATPKPPPAYSSPGGVSGPPAVRNASPAFDDDKLMSEVEKALALIVQVYGDQPISTLSELFEQNKAAIRAQARALLAECLIWRPDDGPTESAG